MAMIGKEVMAGVQILVAGTQAGAIAVITGAAKVVVIILMVLN